IDQKLHVIGAYESQLGRMASLRHDVMTTGFTAALAAVPSSSRCASSANATATEQALRCDEVDGHQEDHERHDAELLPQKATLFPCVLGLQAREAALGRGRVGMLAFHDAVVWWHFRSMFPRAS